MEAPKKRFKTAMAASARSDAPGAAGAIAPSSLATSSLPSDIALAQAIERDGERLATLRAKRETAAKEVMAAEENLLEVKTAVEDAEAIYNNVRADLAASAHAEAHHGDADDEAHAEDWDKYPHFGEGGDGAEGRTRRPPPPPPPPPPGRREDGGGAQGAHKGHRFRTRRGEAGKTSDGSDEGLDEEGPPRDPPMILLRRRSPRDAVQSPEAAAAMKGAVAAAARLRAATATCGCPRWPRTRPPGARAPPRRRRRGPARGREQPHHHAFRPSPPRLSSFCSRS